MQRDVDLIARGPTQSATNQLEIRRVPAALLARCGRSPVVSPEEADLGPMDRGKASGACEIGGLGTFCALGPAVSAADPSAKLGRRLLIGR